VVDLEVGRGCRDDDQLVGAASPVSFTRSALLMECF
jgi:hypothetical protein